VLAQQLEHASRLGISERAELREALTRATQ
jgi:hypothetical protein